jgi:hypothetical protein
VGLQLSGLGQGTTDETEAALAVLDRARQLLVYWDQMPEPVTGLVLVKA